jgi:hypothetical protein
MTIKFNLEGRDEGCAFFALYAGLRMYKEQREQSVSEPGGISIAAAEAYAMLQDMKARFPAHFEDAEEEFEAVYSKKSKYNSPNGLNSK